MSSVSEPIALEDPAEPTTAVEVPFWQKYNAHFEFPSSVVVSILAFVTMFAVIIGVLLAALAGSPDRKPVPIRMVVGGDADGGDGSAGGGGQEIAIAKGELPPEPARQDALPNTTLPEVQNPVPAPRVEDPTVPGQLADPSRTEFQNLVDALRNPGPVGGKKGAGSGAGSGDSAQPGTGPGGTGNDSTRARSLRWSLRFKSASGRDYVDQLAAMRAVIVVPQPPDEQDAFVYRDLANPKPGVKLAVGEWAKLAGQIQFIDTKPDSVRGVAETLGLPFAPRRFLAFFPQELEAELARKETGYRNRRAEDIEETVFRVTVRGGQYDIVVEEQRSKR